jgi:hypothetical protein
LQPVPKVTCANEAGAEAKTRDKAGGENSHPRYLLSVELAKDLGCVALHGQSVQQSCSSKQSVVTGRQNTSQDDGVDNTAGSLGAGHLENKGKGRSAGVLGVEAGVVVGDVEADEENREDTKRLLATCCHQKRQLESHTRRGGFAKRHS